MAKTTTGRGGGRRALATKAADAAVVEVQAGPNDMASMLFQAARDPEVSVEKVKALYDIHRTMQADLVQAEKDAKAERARELFERGLAAVQSMIRPIRKTKTNKQTGSTYAPLEECINGVQDAYTNNGFMLDFNRVECPLGDGWLRIQATLTHEAGHFRTWDYDAPIETSGFRGQANKTLMHAVQSAISYARRQLHAQIFNLAFEEKGGDDDGQSDTTNPRRNGTWDTPDGSFQPPLDYVRGRFSEVIDAVEDAIATKDFDAAFGYWDSLSEGEKLALGVAPSKEGPWSEEAWASLKEGGEFRRWMQERRRQERQAESAARHSGGSAND